MTLPAVPRLLEGIRVIDLTWILVGPGAIRLLASMGAEVICIEPTDPARIDMARYVPPFIQDTPGPPADPYGTDYTAQGIISCCLTFAFWRLRTQRVPFVASCSPPRSCDD